MSPLSSLFRASSNRQRSRSQRKRSASPVKARLLLEQLEDRTLLSSSTTPSNPFLLDPWGGDVRTRVINPDAVPQPPSHSGAGGAGPAGPAGSNVLVNDNGGATATSGFTQSETTIALAKNGNLVVGYNDSGSNNISGSKFTGWSVSTDGGATFTDKGELPTNSFGDAGDPVLAVDNTSGRIYLATLGFNNFNSIPVFRSNDNGLTFSAPVNGAPGIPGGFLDKEWLTVDNFDGPGQGNVYLVVRDFGSTQGIRLFSSTNQGDTFGPAGGTLFVSGSTGNVQGAFVAVGPDHSVYVFWFDNRQTTQRIMMRKSTDQGVTFGSEVTVTTLATTGVNGDLGLTGIRNGTTTPSPFRTSAFPHVTVNPANGDLYVVYNDKGVGADKGDIFLRQSSDGGATWGARLKVNDDATTRDQFMPTVAVTPNGAELGVFWYDRRLDTANNLIDRFGQMYAIAGSTLTPTGPNFRITDVSYLPEFGRDDLINPTYMGDYDQAVADNTSFYLSWGDNRDNLPGGAPRKDPNVRVAQVLALAPAAGPTVLRSAPAGNTIAPINSIRFTFDTAINPDTFTVGQVRSFTGPGAVDLLDIVAGVALVPGSDGKQFDVSFTVPVVSLGHYSMQIGPNILDTADRPMDQNRNGIPGEDPEDRYTANFTIQGPKITASTDQNDVALTQDYLPGKLTAVRLTFNEPMDPATFNPSQVLFSSPTRPAFIASSFTPIPNTNNTRFSVQFPADANLTAAYTLTVLPLMKDLFGNQLDQNGNGIPGEIPEDEYIRHFNTLGPKVTASQIIGDNTNQVYNTLRVTFNEAMAPASFTQSQVKLTAPGGVAVPFSSIVPVTGSNNTQFDIVYPPQGKIGMYAVVLGPNIKDTFENSMDQNGNLIPGETPGDQYSTTFTVQGPKVIATSPTTSLAPVGSLRVTFSKPIDASTFTPDKITDFRGPAGPIGVDGVFVVPGSNFTQFDIDFRPQTATGSGQTLSLDDGSGEQRFNNSAGQETEDNWVANSFQIAPTGDILTSVSLQLRETYTNRPITVVIYTGSSLTDPHAGTGLTRVSTTDTTITGTNGNFVTIPLHAPLSLPPGQVYWAAVLLRGVPGGTFPWSNDTDAPKGRSWFDVGPTQGGAYNLDDTHTATVLGGTHPLLGGGIQSAGNLMLRVNTLGTAYRMVLGPDIHDLFGNKMDQNGNLIDGEIPGDQYLATFNIQGLRITSASPSGTAQPPVDHVRLTFNESVNPATFTLSQVDSLTGPHGAITVTGVSAVPLSNNFQFDVAFAPQSAAGTYTLVVGPHIRDIYSNEMDQNGNGIPGEDPGDRFTTTFSLAGPMIISASPSGSVLPPVDHVRLTFNEPMVPATFTAALVTFTGPGGAIEITGVTPVADSNNTQFDVGFETQTVLGAYTMVIAAGIMDPFGESAPQFTDHFALSPLNNGGFETGDFTGWTTIGATAIKTSSFGTGPTEGTFDALITNGGGPDHTIVEPFLGLAPNALASLVSNVTNGSAIKQMISVSAGSTLTFDWNFLTNEAVGDTTFRDFAFVSITPVGAGGTLVKVADTTSPLVVAPAATGFGHMTGFHTFSFTFTTDGTYTLGVGAMNAGDQTTNSALLVDNFQITPLGGSIDHSGGFADHGDLTANGSMIFAGTAAQLTSGAPGVFNQAGSFFTTSRVDITSFVTSFTFQMTAGTNPVGNGITFTIQGSSPTALGPSGGGLGYGPDQPNTGQRGIRNSVAIKFKTVINVVGQETDNATGLFTDGRSPTVPETGSGNINVNLDSGVIDLKSQNPFLVMMTYDGTTLDVTITDTVTGGFAEQLYTVDIRAQVHSNAAYVGFTGATGGVHTAFQVIQDWTFGPPSPPPGPLGRAASGSNDNGQRPEGNGEAMPASLLVPPATLRFPASASATYRLLSALGTSSSANGGLDSASSGTTSDDFPFELSGRAGKKDHAADLFDTLAGPGDEGNSWL